MIRTEAKTLGEKLRALRREKHLTQEQLAGTFITRNMLSRVETGDVSPSLETLQYLSERLDVPVGYLLSGKNDLLVYRRPALLDELRRRYRSEDWEGVEQLCAEYGLYDDETCLMLCECAVRRGRGAYEAGDPETAEECFDEAMSYAERTVYRTDTVLAEALLYRAFSAQLAGEPSDACLEGYRGYLNGTLGAERYLLGEVLSALAENRTPPVSDEFFTEDSYRTLCCVWRTAARGDYAEAQNLLSVVIDAPEIGGDPLLRRVCTEQMESCAEKAGDYKTAYLYAKKRRSADNL